MLAFATLGEDLPRGLVICMQKDASLQPVLRMMVECFCWITITWRVLLVEISIFPQALAASIGVVMLAKNHIHHHRRMLNHCYRLDIFMTVQVFTAILCRTRW